MKTTSVSIDPVTDRRFELVRPLGEGATGAVFLALDRETGEHVALKKLFKLDQKSVLRFKREFRSLADIHHPNLVKLYDLHRGQEAWFITMEHVAGKDLRQKLSTEATLSRETLQPANDTVPSELLTIFYDLACGVHAIHRAGMLHRDLKPSNVLVADNGRVVVLDFGLVREIESSVHVTQDGTVAGTPAYMPPEQAMGAKLSEASDWYAFGAILYEAISGVLPIDGRNATALLQRKLTQDPTPLQTGAPREVLGLCTALLSRDPKLRPSGTQVLETLAAASGGVREPVTVQEHPQTVEPTALTTTQPLFGRDTELAQLHAAWEAPGRSGSLVLHVRGASGSGKSTLVEHFLDDAAGHGFTPPVILRSRCYEREAMPFKALDGVLDALVSHLSLLDDVTCAHVLPTDVSDLALLFPALDRLNAVQRLRAARRGRGDETQTRQRAEQALRALVTSVAGQRRLLLWIDDMQWGDLDSAGVLRDWLEHPLEGPVTIVLTYRSEEIHTSASLALLLDRPEETVRDAQVTLDLDPLRASDVRTLCQHRLAQRSHAPEAMIERIVQESHGNPFLAQQLTAIAEAKLARHDTSLDGLSMEALVQRASSFVGDSARAILNVLAIAGRPLQVQLALSTSGVISAGRAHIHTLRSLRLIRTREASGERLLEVYHDRVRETVQASLSAEESQRIHAALLQELQAQGRDDHDWLHTLAVGAEQRGPAFRHGLLAAERASASLAFERAAELYSKCLVLFNGELEQYELWKKLATAEAQCRRGYAAARAYAHAAQHAPAAQRSQLLQLAASHLVRSGRFAEGERVVQQVLETEKLPVPKTHAGLLAAIAWERGRIALRSFDVPARPEPSNELAHDALLYGTLSVETQMYAPLRSALFQARALRLALDYGTSTQVARAMCLAATVACISGTRRAAQRSHDLLNRAEHMFKQSGSQDVQVELLSARAVCAQFLGNFEDAIEPADAVESMVASRTFSGMHGDYYYMFTVRMVQISALQSIGRLLEARQVLQKHVTLARATDNLAAILQVSMNRAIDEQALDMCAGSRARLDTEHAQLPSGGELGILTVGHMLAVMRAACANRDYDWAFSRLEEYWLPYQRSIVHGSAFVACLAHTTHARLLLNHHVDSGARGDAAALVREDLAQLAHLPSGLMADVPIARTRARLAALQGNKQQAIELLRKCLAHLGKNMIRQEIEHDRYALGLLVGGSEGTQLLAAAREGLRNCGISDPDADMRAYVPELLGSNSSG